MSREIKSLVQIWCKAGEELVKIKKETNRNKANGLSFSDYYCALKDAIEGKVSDHIFMNILFELITVPAGIVNRNGQPIFFDSGEVSRIKNGTKDIPPAIRNARTDERVSFGIEASFSKRIVSRLCCSKTDGLRNRIASLICNSGCSENVKMHFVDLSKEGSLSKFLAEAFLESLAWPNRKPGGGDNKSKVNTKDEVLPSLTIPYEVTAQEMPYVNALMKVYREEEKTCSLNPSNINQYPRREAHFKRQRKDYYAAETIKRGLRDAYDESELDQFSVLENEIYDGVIDVYERDYESGMARLSETLSQAVLVGATKCLAVRDTAWIGSSEKKGVCHILVNDKRISGWCSSDL